MQNQKQPEVATAICCPLDLNANCLECGRLCPPVRKPLPGITRAIDFIDDKLCFQITLKDMADAAHMSMYHFSREFRVATGRAPISYLRYTRIRLARCLIRKNKLTLAQVAIDCGFASQPHFTTAFKRETGSTPAKWRSAARVVSSLLVLSLEFID